MADEIRKFSISDNRLLEHGSTVLMMFPADLPAFGEFDTTFGPGSIARLEALQEAAAGSTTHATISGELAEHTDSVNDCMQRCHRAHRKIIYFVGKAFPGNRGALTQFGADSIGAARKNQAAMLTHLGLLAGAVAKYRAELEAVGATAALLDSIPALRLELDTANSRQELFKRGRVSTTDTRVSALNRLYDELMLIADAAELVFEDDPSEAARYRLPQPRRSGGSDEDPDGDPEPQEPAA